MIPCFCSLVSVTAVTSCNPRVCCKPPPTSAALDGASVRHGEPMFSATGECNIDSVPGQRGLPPLPRFGAFESLKRWILRPIRRFGRRDGRPRRGELASARRCLTTRRPRGWPASAPPRRRNAVSGRSQSTNSTSSVAARRDPRSNRAGEPRGCGRSPPKVGRTPMLIAPARIGIRLALEPGPHRVDAVGGDELLLVQPRFAVGKTERAADRLARARPSPRARSGGPAAGAASATRPSASSRRGCACCSPARRPGSRSGDRLDGETVARAADRGEPRRHFRAPRAEREVLRPPRASEG